MYFVCALVWTFLTSESCFLLILFAAAAQKKRCNKKPEALLAICKNELQIRQRFEFAPKKKLYARLYRSENAFDRLLPIRLIIINLRWMLLSPFIYPPSSLACVHNHNADWCKQQQQQNTVTIKMHFITNWMHLIFT